MRKLTFSRAERLRRTADFDRAYTEGKKVASSSLVLFFCPSGGDTIRLGVSVSKKIGKAVVRNRVKRVLRESFRLNRHRLRKGFDILLVARAGIQAMRFRQVEAVVLDLFRRGGLICPEAEKPPEEGSPGDG